MCVLKEIISLSVCGVLTSSKFSVYIWSKGNSGEKMGQLYAQEIAIFLLLLLLFRFDSRISLNAALTNMKLGREIKLCDPTSIGMVKIMHFSENKKKQSRPIHFDWHTYVHVTDKVENETCNFYALTVSIILGKYQQTAVH